MSLGKLVIQQLDSAKEAGPRLYYYKFPQELKEKHVLLFDAILASANAIIMGIRVLLDHECREDQILVCCMFASPEGLAAVLTVFPQVRVIVGCVEKGLDDNMHLVPGIGAFSARYYSHDLKEEDYVEAERKVPHV